MQPKENQIIRHFEPLQVRVKLSADMDNGAKLRTRIIETMVVTLKGIQHYFSTNLESNSAHTL